MPLRIMDLFGEESGAHFDILHFEYRPEIILKAKYFGGNKNVDLENWYGDIDVNENIEGIINLINNKLGE